MMAEWIRNWVLSMTGAALVCAAALRLTPEGRVKGVLRSLCALTMAAALLSPLLRGGVLPDYAQELARYRAAAEALRGEGEALGQELDRGIIEQRMEAYILDKARFLGTALSGARVHLRWSTEGVWLPESAELTGTYSETLSRWLEAEFGIPRKAQSWRTDEGD